MLLTCAAASAGAAFEPSVPGLWRRYLTVILDGMSPAAAGTLEPGPPRVDEIEKVEPVSPPAARRRTG
jgi:hypothetical protein